MISPNNDHLTAHDTYASATSSIPHTWDKVGSTRRGLRPAYDTIVNADQWHGVDVLNEAYWAHHGSLRSHPRGAWALHSHDYAATCLTTTYLTTTCLTTHPTTSDAHVVFLSLAPIFGAYFQPCRRPLWTPAPAARPRPRPLALPGPGTSAGGRRQPAVRSSRNSVQSYCGQPWNPATL